MKKISLFFLFSVFLLGDLNIVPDDSSGASMFYSMLVVLAPSYASKHWSEGSSKASEDSSGIKEKETAELTYEHYKALSEKKFVEANVIFTELGMKKLELAETDFVELTEIRVGIFITNEKKNLALIPSKEVYYDLVDRTMR